MRRAGDRKTPSRSREGSRETARSVAPEGVAAAATRKPPFSLHRPASTSRSLQRFNAIPCKFVCGQVYTVPGLSVSSVHPRPVAVPRSPPSPPLQSAATSAASPPPRHPGSTSPREHISTHAAPRLCSCLCLYRDVYTERPEKARAHERARERARREHACS